MGFAAIELIPMSQYNTIPSTCIAEQLLNTNVNCEDASVRRWWWTTVRAQGRPWAQARSPNLRRMATRCAKAAGIELIHIPYRGGAPAVADAIGGQVSMVMDGLAAAVPHLKSGALKGLGLTSPTRSDVLPDVPTFEEQGFKGNIVEGWAGIAAPVGTPRPILEKLASSIREVMALPALQERYRAASSLPGSMVLDDMQRFVRADAEAWRPLVIASGATVD